MGGWRRRAAAGTLGGVRGEPSIDEPERTSTADFLTDVTTLRQRAREHIEQGPITAAYGADRQRVIDVLNEALATEIVCVLRYKRHYYTAAGTRTRVPGRTARTHRGWRARSSHVSRVG